MANKKTVIEMYQEILPLCETEEQKAFIEKRIEITQKKNASGKGGEPTPKQKERMALNAEIENAIVAVMAEGTPYTPSDLVKLVGRTDVPNTQKLTPRLTAMVDNGRLVKSVVKGRTYYALPTAD